jgi:F-type H+-transporting ATPase subunit c
MKRVLTNSWLWATGVLMASSNVFAEEHVAAEAASGNWARPIAAGLGIAIAVVAASTAQGKIAASYMDGVSRNPGAQKAMGTQLILSLVFVETLVLFTLFIALQVK